MTIHHATMKKAQSLQITLVEEEVGSFTQIRASGSKPDFEFAQMRPAKEVLANAEVWQMIAVEYPHLMVFFSGSDEGFFIMQDYEEIGTGETMKEAWEEAMDNVVEPEGDDESEEDTGKPSSFAILQRKKEVYRERGNVNHCGDWIAKELEGEFTVVDDNGVERFDDDEFTRMLVANGVEMTGKWTLIPSTGGKGWQGRYRMNGRQRLEVALAKSGVLKIGTSSVTVPKAILAELRQKHNVEN